MSRQSRQLLVGEKFGLLTVTGEAEKVKKYGRSYSTYPCVCDCGKKTSATYAALTSGRKKSCGHIPSGGERNLVGKRYGRLLVIEKTSERKSHTFVYRCLCDCGKYVNVPLSNLTSGNTNSCGCFSKETSARNIAKNANVHDGISEDAVKFIVSGRLQKNNTSGVTGVYWVGRSQSWRAEITFRGHKRTLIETKSKAAAIKARKRAEIELFGDYYDKYSNRKEAIQCQE
jgi:hypothetical protein